METKIPERLKGIFKIFKSEGHHQRGEENENEDVYDTLTPKVSNDARMNISKRWTSHSQKKM
ncbi:MULTISPECIES: hypothetical protein [Pantoea]|uniref:hypothetical protein n=1 Tax=Pantoea TaxID=53335 RepID=UPI001F3544ED|nr:MULTISPECIES: hypothetical protein [Pantoea]UIL54552.1 hypothetical protein LZU96_20600 [Pantoea agglomerans]